MKTANQDELHIRALEKSLKSVINYCMKEGLQLVTRTEDPDDDNGDTALVVCLHGDPKLIDELHNHTGAFVNCNIQRFTP